MKGSYTLSDKIYVLDTSVLLAAGQRVLYAFGGGKVVLPMIVIEELEKKRNDPNGQSTNAKTARRVLREIEKLRQKGNLSLGVEINKEGGTLRVELNHVHRDSLPDQFQKDYSADTRILTVANNLSIDEQRKGEAGEQVVLVTKDLPLRIKTDVILPNLEIMPYSTSGNSYSGFRTEYVNSDVIPSLHSNTLVTSPASVNAIEPEAHNHAFELVNSSNPSNKTLAIRSGKNLRKIKPSFAALGSLKAANAEQSIALDYLYDKSIEILSLGGRAGTGKTLLSVVAAIDQVVEKKEYSKVVVLRPMYAVGDQEIGYLPGTAEEKMDPWKQAVYDSVEGIVPPSLKEELDEQGLLTVDPITFLRGRTFHGNFVIVDEAQNFSEPVLLSIASRVGKDSKIVFLWDSMQRDNASLGVNDGIVEFIEEFRNEPYFAHVSLSKSQRSKIAERAGTILEEYWG